MIPATQFMIRKLFDAHPTISVSLISSASEFHVPSKSMVSWSVYFIFIGDEIMTRITKWRWLNERSHFFQKLFVWLSTLYHLFPSFNRFQLSFFLRDKKFTLHPRNVNKVDFWVFRVESVRFIKEWWTVSNLTTHPHFSYMMRVNCIENCFTWIFHPSVISLELTISIRAADKISRLERNKK